MQNAREGRDSARSCLLKRTLAFTWCDVPTGPGFRKGVVVKPFENVSIYNVLCRVLGLTPAKNDEDPKVVECVLRRP